MHMERNVKKSYAITLNYNFQKLSETRGWYIIMHQLPHL